MKILILDAHSNASLAVLQSLGNAGYETYLAGTSPDVVSWSSRYPRDRFIYTDPFQDKQAFKDWIGHLQQEHQFDYIIPVTDATLYPLMELRREGQFNQELILPSEESFDWIFDKGKTLELADQLNVHYPKSTLVNASNWDSHPEMRFPIFLKPVRSKVWEGNQGAELAPKLVHNQEALNEQMQRFLPLGDVLIQEYAQGDGVGIEVLCNHGEILLSFAHKRIHEYPLTGGGSTYRQSIKMPENLLEASQKLLRQIKWHGVAMVEFKMNNEAYWLMEINGRFWGSLPLAIYAGVDFPKALIEMLSGNLPVPNASYRINVYARKLRGDFAWFKSNLKANKNDPFLMTQNPLTSFFQGFRIFFGKECWDHASLKDPWPIIKECTQLLSRELSIIINKVLMKMILRQARKKSIDALKNTPIQRILVLCYGNICRSPFVEYYLKKLLNDGSPYEIKSSGFYPVPLRTSPSSIVDIAGEKGINLKHHRSTVINEDLIDWADIIIIMDLKNWQLLKEYKQSALEKTIWLGAFNNTAKIELEDPYQKPKDKMERIIEELRFASEKFAALLQERK